MIVVAAIAILFESIRKWIGGLQLEHLGTGALTILIAGILDAGLGYYLLRIGRRVGSRSRAISDWCRWKIPVAIGDGWDTSPSRGVRCCVFCWWKRPRSRYAARQIGAANMCTNDAAWTQDGEGCDGRRLAVRLYWMMRQGWDYQQWIKFGSHAGQPGTGDGVPPNIEKLIGRPAPLQEEGSSK